MLFEGKQNLLKFMIKSINPGLLTTNRKNPTNSNTSITALNMADTGIITEDHTGKNRHATFRNF